MISVPTKQSIVPLPADVLESRQPVWEALSEFWLDTELQDADLNYIAKLLADSPYSLEEIEAIHHNEVAPAVSANLLGIAGEWTGVNKAWLVQQCHRNALRRYRISHRIRVWLQKPMFWCFIAQDWQRVIPRLRALRRADLSKAN